jgi:hypothetical protein
MKKKIILGLLVGLFLIGFTSAQATDKPSKPLSFEVALGSIPNTSFDTTFVLTPYDLVIGADYDAIVIDHYMGYTDHVRQDPFPILMKSKQHKVLLIHAALKTPQDIPEWENQLNLSQQTAEQLITLISTLRKNLFEESNLSFTDPHQKEAWLKLKEKPIILAGASFGGKTSALMATDAKYHDLFDGYFSAAASWDPSAEKSITDQIGLKGQSWSSIKANFSYNWPVFNLGNLSKPLFILHGLKDVRVSPGNSQAVLKYAPEEKRHLIYSFFLEHDDHDLKSLLRLYILPLEDHILHFVKAVIDEKQGTGTFKDEEQHRG